MKFIFFVCTLILGSSLIAQNATIKGVVMMKEEWGDEPAFLMTIKEMKSGVYTTTNDLGEYTLSVPAGEVRIKAIGLLGYAGGEEKVVKVKKGETISLDFYLIPENVVEVVDNYKATGNVAETEDVKNSDEQKSVMTSETMSEKGVSDAAAGAVKTTGVSAQGSGRIYVRGLGDRYNNAYLNGMSLPSFNPDLKVMPLNVFPSSVLQKLSVSKTYASDKFGDFGGANIDIETLEFDADAAFVEIGLSAGVNLQAIAQPFKVMNPGATDFLGWDNGTRALQGDVRDAKLYNASANTLDIPQEPFSAGWDVNQMTPVNYGIDITWGQNFVLNPNRKEGSKKVDLGIIFNVGQSSSNSYRDGLTRVVNTQGGLRQDYAKQTWENANATTALLSGVLRIGDYSKLKFTSLFVNDAQNTLDEYLGWHNDYLDADETFFIRRNTFTQNQLFTNQLVGSHDRLFGAKRFGLNYGVAYSIANSDEPDRKQNVLRGEQGSDVYRMFILNNAENNRYFSELRERELSANVAFNYHYLQTEKQGVVKNNGTLTLGAQLKNKSRDFFWRQINYNVEGMRNFQIDANNMQNYFTDENFAKGLYQLREQPDPSRYHDIQQQIFATYLNTGVNVNNRLRLLGGVRLELGNQNVNYRDFSVKLDDPYLNSNIVSMDILPHVGMKLKLDSLGKQQFRMAASKSISRPGFKEMAGFVYEEMFGGGQVQGNPNLINGSVYGVDLKYEIYPAPGNMFAVGIFGKMIENPIEKVAKAGSGILYSYINSHQAIVGGIEAEWTQNLGVLFGKDSSILNKFTIGTNAAYIYSRVRVVENEKDLTANGNAFTNIERPLQGATPIVANFDVTYEFAKGMTAALVYNYMSDKIVAAGQQGLAELYESGYHTLNVVVKARLGKKDQWGLGLSVNNVLNPTIERAQDINPVDDASFKFLPRIERVAGGGLSKNFRLIDSYKKGITLGLSASYKF